jgi:hypothetical protein
VSGPGGHGQETGPSGQGNPTGSGVHGKVFLARVGDERWVHLGSINGSEELSPGRRSTSS